MKFQDKRNSNEAKLNIDEGTWVSGLYFVHIIDEHGQREVMRIIK